MRAGEVCQMRTCDIDRSGKVWVYRPQTHKTAHHGHKREIFIGPKSQKVLAPFLKMDLQAYVFSPADAEAARHAAQHEAREKPPQPSQMLRMQRAASRRRRRPPGEKYDVASYRRAITRACVMASELPAPLARQKGETVSAWKTRLTPEQHAAVKTWRREHHWHPHQLRHNFATEIRRDYGADVELVLLGDKVTRMADVYGAKDRGTAERVIAEVG
jgi:integrase